MSIAMTNNPGSLLGLPDADEPRSGVASIRKTLSVLELIAERGGATAKEIAHTLGLALPTVYRILNTLVDADYLVHLKARRRYELGYKVHALGISLHRQIGLPDAIRREVVALHRTTQRAAYLAIYRGADVVLAFVADSPAAPRITPLQFGFHEAAHATAFGKILLAGMSQEQREAYLRDHALEPLTPSTITDRHELEAELQTVMDRGLAWERQEFVPGHDCAAVGVRNAAGMVIGSVAMSAPSGAFDDRILDSERALRDSAARLSRYLRSGRIPD